MSFSTRDKHELKLDEMLRNDRDSETERSRERTDTGFNDRLIRTRLCYTLPGEEARFCSSNSFIHHLILPMIVKLPASGIRLLSNPNDTTSGTRARIASLLALLVAALAEIVGAGVHDNGAAQHALRADQLDELVGLSLIHI